MIVVRAPLRISFVGGGTDLPDFYRRYTGRVLSTTVDKYIYVVVNKTPLIPKISARYKISETVDRPDQLQHTRIKAALLDLKLKKGIEIASFGDLPAKTGLGSSSSFSVALLMALNALQGKKIKSFEAAESSCRLEIDLVGEPIGKQDQYAATFGGINIFEFKRDDSVNIIPVYLDYKIRLEFENHLLVFFTGITRDASSVLKEQKVNINKKMFTLKQMADSVFEFKTLLESGNFKEMGKMLHQGWLRKKSLASKISSGFIDQLYKAGINNGAWGGKIHGAGGGGCISFLTPVDKKNAIRQAVKKVAKSHKLSGFKEVPIRFVQSGAEIIFNSER